MGGSIKAGLTSGNLGYPRIGEKREWKKHLEAYWGGKLEEKALLNEMKNIRLEHLRKQKEAGIDWISVGDFSFYDSMLDTAAMFGIVPERFGHSGGAVSLATYFAMARGNQSTPACEMTKWFNTNYHYIVPEFGDRSPELVENRLLALYKEAKETLGIDGRPVVIGPYTFLKLSKGYERERFKEVLESLLPVYAQLLQELEREGVQWVQVDEPALVTTVPQEEMKMVQESYQYLHSSAPKLDILLQTYFDSAEHYPELISLPVQAIGLDFVHGRSRNLASLEKHGFPADKVLAAGVVDGRNIWRSDLDDRLELLESISRYVPYERMIVQPSCSLLHVPINLEAETALPAELRNALAYADEKLTEVVALTQAVRVGHEQADVKESLASSRKALQALNESPQRAVRSVEVGRAVLAAKPRAPFAERRQLQQEALGLPVLPTTTIGSFPQTAEVRRARRQWRKGEWSKEQYAAFIREQIGEWIAIQEQIGLDVLVHGEFERTDMVEFFGEKLAGFAFTANGWVQSYGSRCVKPPIIWGNVDFVEPMTVEETVYAQSLTNKPVKGMLTGPVTVLNWSFVRDDLPRKEVAEQLALALRKEVEGLEKAGIRMIQVDEPAVREGLPLKKEDHEEYLNWAVEAFRLTTSGVEDSTQIHTHMCYCEFSDSIDAIREMDADVISIETSRSHGELLESFGSVTYDKGIGLGVYDIHSPRVPSVEEMSALIRQALQVLPPSLFWINPDCGLKTRAKEETVQSLKHMVQAARQIRASL
ncbi:5-methyltetrahydropteroyltriglutamate--homocysteine S-methyltransferase [Paenibacillus sp. J2TS4]|uniref:5-methyltetrahydropteroyltriglutamate-- homocysteine S-methyltransferase n=1 Tax=Paenibacillus sp. J2TS4 TaxID=2807194 RepID=UPI001AFD1CB6|nr:5-methyltetrahydropteroyltriglutamate--homocysteine S-methyltransferase [Paenibacillus sp. J2TS4]GIP34048.1 5-methyltetrahydropteroyltriglutamate--homocysteine methyltransferase [Paenibacillus sp. J2TS4]